MFGYVRPAVPELRVHEHATYRAFYCGVCRGLGRQCGPLCRLLLQYDFVLLALCLDLVLEEEAVVAPGRCCVWPMRCLACARGEALAYAADAHGLLLLGKALDDRQDGGKLRHALPLLRRWTRGAAARRPELAAATYALLEAQANAETAGCTQDEAAEPFAAFCQGMFTPPQVPERYREAMGWLGRNVGRWVYLADALDDFERDAKKGRFNALDAASRKQAAERALPEMDLCADQALAALDLLPARRHARIVRNILEPGMTAVTEAIARGTHDRARHDDLRAIRP